ncbi:hypothetical protein C8Q76DRAFT_623620 [Earliella scabrosa]|nr:hypothetical protein C8Q76DRAFT_623620 [Earliella scabrosa]
MAPCSQVRSSFARYSDDGQSYSQGFHQYGTITWATFYKWLQLLLDTHSDWIIVGGDRYASEQYFAGDALVMPGKYTLLAAGRHPPSRRSLFALNLTPAYARRRQQTPTLANDCREQLARVADRDGKCMVLGQLLMWNKLQPVHIFARAHATEWTTKGYPGLITDTASEHKIGGSSKISSVQNLLLLSAQLHAPWADYNFGVDPDDGYRITAFAKGLDSVVGRELQLDHISDPTTRPLDQLLRDHFLQCLLKHVKGVGERTWDYDHTFGIGAFDLSDRVVWGTEEGKERLEVELENRLFEFRLQQEDPVCS